MMHPTPEQVAYMKAHIDDDRTKWLLGVNVACLVVAWGSVALRYISRWKIGTKFGLDDWLICGAAACVTGHVSCLLATMRNGMGRHIILLKEPRNFVITTLTAQTFYNLTIPFIKLSILCLYRRIFCRTHGWFMPTLWFTALFVFLFTIPQCFVYIFQCVPIESLWSELAPGSRVFCINFRAAIIAFGVINIVTDWWILAIPIPVVLGLQLDTRTRWSICSLFLIGGFVCILSIIRLIYAKDVETADPTWDYIPISSISTLEACAGILAACMPTWRPLFRFLGRGITSYFSGSRSGGNSDLNYGNNVDVGRGGWNHRSRSRSRSRKNFRVPPEKHYPSGNRMSFKPGTKRSDTSMSGESVENILKGNSTTHEIELELTKSSTLPDVTPSSQSHISTSTSRFKPDPHELNLATTSDSVSYTANAGADRWESLMKQQRIKNIAEEREKRGRPRAASPSLKPGKNYGDVAFGGGAVAAMGFKEREEAVRKESGERDGAIAGASSNGGGGWNIGLEGIVVTKTVTSVSGEGRRSGEGR